MGQYARLIVWVGGVGAVQSGVLQLECVGAIMVKSWEEIEKVWRSFPKLYVPEESSDWPYDWGERKDDCTYTLSPDSGIDGWNTDSGYPGYGLPKHVAQTLARARSDILYLIGLIRGQDE